MIPLVIIGNNKADTTHRRVTHQHFHTFIELCVPVTPAPVITHATTLLHFLFGSDVHV